MTLTVRAHETGMIRVFALSMDDAEAEALKSNTDAQKAALGVDDLDPEFIEVFPVSDLGTLGLAEYLTIGNGVPSGRIDPDRTKLGALDGWVLLVFSNAFNDAPAQIEPGSALTHIGTYAEEGVDWTPVDIETSSTDLYTGPVQPVQVTPKSPKPKLLIALTLAILALMVFALTR